MIIEKAPKWYQRINNEFLFFPILNLIMIVIDSSFFMDNLLWFEVVFIGTVIVLMSRKKSRQVKKLEINPDVGLIYITYYQYIIFKNIKVFRLDNITYEFRLRSYGIGNLKYTLTIFNLGKAICSIMDKHEFGWNKQDLERIANFAKRSCSCHDNTLAI